MSVEWFHSSHLLIFALIIIWLKPIYELFFFIQCEDEKNNALRANYSFLYFSFIMMQSFSMVLQMLRRIYNYTTIGYSAAALRMPFGGYPDS